MCVATYMAFSFVWGVIDVLRSSLRSSNNIRRNNKDKHPRPKLTNPMIILHYVKGDSAESAEELV